MGKYHRDFIRIGLLISTLIGLGIAPVFTEAFPLEPATPAPNAPIFLVSNLQYSPTLDHFVTNQFLAAYQNPLSNVELTASTGSISAAGLIDRVALRYGINPRVIITFINSQSKFGASQFLTRENLINNPFGLKGKQYTSLNGFELQIQWLTNVMSNALVLRENSETYTQVQFADGSTASVSYNTTTGNFVILSALAQIGYPEQLQNRYDDFLNEYISLFGDPSKLSFDASQVTIPPMKLPFNGEGRYTSGPHAGETASCVLVAVKDASALDFGAPTPGTSFPVLNVADGILKNVADIESSASIDFGWTVSVELANSGGLAVLYAHLNLSSSDVARLTALKGSFIPQGYVIGNSGQSGGQASIHLHLDLRYVGTTYDSYSTIGTHFPWDNRTIDGWTAHIHRSENNGVVGYNYQGSLIKGSSKQLEINALCGSLKKWATVGINYTGTNETNGADPNTIFADKGTSGKVSSSNSPINDFSVFNVASGDVTGLVNAINSANSDNIPSIVKLSPGIYTLTSLDNTTTGPTGLPIITTPITIIGDATIQRDASAPLFRIFAVGLNGNLTLRGVTASNKLVISQGKISDSNTHGAGIYNIHGTVQVYDTVFDHNDAGAGTGGAIYSGSGSLTIRGSDFSDNTARSGGAINADDGLTTIDASVFIHNQANPIGGLAGAILAGGTETVHITNSKFLKNEAYAFGGAIYSGALLSIEGSIFQENKADGSPNQTSGGGILAFGASTITNSTFANNTVKGADPARTQGGNIYYQGASDAAHINYNCIVGNSGQGVFNLAGYPILDATHNWWGSSNDPLGNSVSSNVNYQPFSNVPLQGCPSNDSLIDSKPITVSSTVTASSTLASKGNDEPTSACGTNVDKTLWYTLTATNAGTLHIQSSSVDFISVLSIWSGTLNSLTELTCSPNTLGLAALNVSVAAIAGTTSVQVNVATGSTYYISVGGDSNSGGDFTLTSSFVPEPPPNAAPLRNYYTTGTPTLTWSRVSWAVGYMLQIADNKDFIGATTYSVGNVLAFTPPSPLTDGTYYWRVQACSSSTSCGLWSAMDSFVIAVGG